MIYTKEFFIPENDELRLKKLYDYQILDTHQEDTFDKIAQLAAKIMKTPYAFVTFVDEDRIFIKANISPLDGNVLPREKSLCSVAILNNECTIINDSYAFEDMQENVELYKKYGIRFYAAAPLRSPEGYHLGTVCVADKNPRYRKTSKKKAGDAKKPCRHSS